MKDDLVTLPRHGGSMTTDQPLTFRAWLHQHIEANGPIGDLARDVHADRNWPTGPDDLARYEQHLNDHNADPEAIRALRRAWKLYRKQTSG